MTCVITQRLRDTKGPRLALNVPLFPETTLPFDTLAGRCACWCSCCRAIAAALLWGRGLPMQQQLNNGMLCSENRTGLYLETVCCRLVPQWPCCSALCGQPCMQLTGCNALQYGILLFARNLLRNDTDSRQPYVTPMNGRCYPDGNGISAMDSQP